MSTPTDQQQIRATLRRAERNMGAERAAYMAIDQAGEILGDAAVILAAVERLPLIGEGDGRSLPELMGTAEVAAAYGIANSNISKLSDPPVPVQRISGGKTPVYLASEVMAKVDAWKRARG